MTIDPARVAEAFAALRAGNMIVCAPEMFGPLFAMVETDPAVRESASILSHQWIAPGDFLAVPDRSRVYAENGRVWFEPITEGAP